MSAATWQTKDGVTLFEGTFPCPYCGHENRKWFPVLGGRPEVVLCDNETGGCDEYFAVEASVEVEVTAFPYRLVRP